MLDKGDTDMFRLNCLLLVIVLLFTSCDKKQNRVATYRNVDIKDTKIKVKGANYVDRSGEHLCWSRFSEEVLSMPSTQSMFNADKARTNSGVRMQFKTKSDRVKLVFLPQLGDNRGAAFAINQNGQPTQTFEFNAQESSQQMTIEVVNQHPGLSTYFEVVMPSWANVALNSMELWGTSELEELADDSKPVYLAIGNSITHGVGQGSATYLTYPYLVAKSLGYDYYNLAVGGAKVSQAIADMTDELPKADLITILIGYNDLIFSGKPMAEYITAYESYLRSIRNNHPYAKIYCITLTYTKAEKSEKTGITPDQYRLALRNFIYHEQSKGDKRLFLIEGDEISSVENLRDDNPNDKVHFSIKGAELFAKELIEIIGE